MESTAPVSWLRWTLRVGLLIPALLLLPGLIGASAPAPQTDDDQLAALHYARVRAHLQQDTQYGGLLGLPVSGWKSAAISQMAAGLMSMAVDARQEGDDAQLEELEGLLEEAARRVLAVENSPYDVPLDEVEDFNDWGFYLGHVGLTLGCYRYVSGDSTFDLLHRRIIRYQLARMTADGDQHARSYPNSYKWPADQALTLAGAHLYDRIHGSRLSVDPIDRWLAAVEARSDGGLHPLTLTDNSALPVTATGENIAPLDSAATPRGSGLSPTAFYMAQFAPNEAAALYARYRGERWTHRLGLGGFREWPAGAGGWDLEGGPTALGLGSLATAQGLAPARLFGDEAAYGSILRSVQVAAVPERLGSGRGYLLAPLLVEAWLFNGVTARPWFEPPPALELEPARAPAPVGAWLLLLMDLGLIGGLVVPPLLRRRSQPAAAAEESVA